jgi:ribosomal protein L7Ae-like RNA K-turn-binding protein
MDSRGEDLQSRQAILRLLGLALRAGKLNLGSGPVLRALHQGQGGVVFLSRDAGTDLRAKIVRALGTARLDAESFGGDELAAAFGRRLLSVVSVCEPAFVAGVVKHLGNLS